MLLMYTVTINDTWCIMGGVSVCCFVLLLACFSISFGTLYWFYNMIHSFVPPRALSESKEEDHRSETFNEKSTIPVP